MTVRRQQRTVRWLTTAQCPRMGTVTTKETPTPAAAAVVAAARSRRAGRRRSPGGRAAHEGAGAVAAAAVAAAAAGDEAGAPPNRSDLWGPHRHSAIRDVTEGAQILLLNCTSVSSRLYNQNHNHNSNCEQCVVQLCSVYCSCQFVKVQHRPSCEGVVISVHCTRFNTRAQSSVISLNVCELRIAAWQQRRSLEICMTSWLSMSPRRVNFKHVVMRAFCHDCDRAEDIPNVM